MAEQKKELVALGADRLADALLELAIHVEAADDLIERLIASPSENLQKIKKKLGSLKRSRRFVRWGASSRLAQELEDRLLDIKASTSDPLMGAELVISFYETDKGTLGNCDDSSGFVGDVYRISAQELFVEYASGCTDKKPILKRLIKLSKKDDYGVRDSLIHCANQYLLESDIRKLIAEFQKLSDTEKDEYKKRHWLLLIESLARQVKDAKLFEQTRIAAWGKLSTAAYIDIARVYFEAKDTSTALSWLEKISKDDTYQAHERDNLFIDIYRKLGDDEKLTKILYRKFRNYRSMATLKDLLAVTGKEKEDEILSDEISVILSQDHLKESDATFLINIGKIDEAESYLIERADQLNGIFYETLLSLAQSLESEERFLITSLIYRSLLISILERGYTKAYPHGIRYLKILDKLETSVINWEKFDSHTTFKETIHTAHGRKRSFWSKYVTL